MKRFEIISKKTLAERVNEYVVYAPAVARHCLAGQFVILRVDEEGERVPFTICDYSREEGFARYSNRLEVVTDDGSKGRKGFVTDAIRALVESGEHYDAVFAVGPLPMMKAVCALTAGFGIHTVVSMNSLMVDGTGMCGCCRLTVGGEVKYACIDGPEFDGHKVDFDEAIQRSRMYREQEQAHLCRLGR